LSYVRESEKNEGEKGWEGESLIKPQWRSMNEEGEGQEED